MTKANRLLIFLFFMSLLLVSCSTPQGDLKTQASPAMTEITNTPTPFQPNVIKLQLSEEIPGDWINLLDKIGGIELLAEAGEASLEFGVLPEHGQGLTDLHIVKVFAVLVPFFTVVDGIASNVVKSIWLDGSYKDPNFDRIIVNEQTKLLLDRLWGISGSAVEVIPDDIQILPDELEIGKIAILPFEEISPRWKVLKVDGISPLDKPMDERNYPLIVRFGLSGISSDQQQSNSISSQLLAVLPPTNRDETRMTVLIMTGTTAITRVTTTKIELNGYDYPIELVKEWFNGADLKHISNEVSFDENCPDLSPVTMRFCSKVDLIKVLEKLGINVVESTGNHLNDYGVENFVRTLQMYEERGWLNYGGSIDQESAKAPVTVEKNGNKVAFIGCNTVGFTSAWATENSAGAAQCEREYLLKEISQLKSEGYIVVATYQFQEIDATMYDTVYRTDFHDAALAGADIVQGSQSHVPMGFEFIGDSLIHYGLGNFIFDQMEPINRREFIDRHILYNGKYINTELLTAKLVDWARPTPMSMDERRELLSEIFNASKVRSNK